MPVIKSTKTRIINYNECRNHCHINGDNTNDNNTNCCNHRNRYNDNKKNCKKGKPGSSGKPSSSGKGKEGKKSLPKPSKKPGGRVKRKSGEPNKGEKGTLVQYWKFKEERVKTDENDKANGLLRGAAENDSWDE